MALFRIRMPRIDIETEISRTAAEKIAAGLAGAAAGIALACAGAATGSSELMRCGAGIVVASVLGTGVAVGLGGKPDEASGGALVPA
jgi:hypothetical protein